MRFDLVKQSQRIEIGDNRFARGKPVEFAVGLWGIIVDAGIFVEDVHQRQIVPHADFIVVEVVRRRDFHTAAAEFAIDVLVGNDGDVFFDQWQPDAAANERLVALIVRVNGDGSVTEHCFGSGGCHHQMIATIPGCVALGQWIAKVPQVTLLFRVFDFQVRYGRSQFRIPVDQPFASINQVVFVQTHKDFEHSAGKAVIESEAFA